MFSQFLESNKYTMYYIGIISRARTNNNNNDVYYETHHILPKSVFPEYKNLKKHPWNSVRLTPREHFICHWLLTKMFSSTRKIKQMQKAFAGLAMQNEHQVRILTPRQYEIIRNSVSAAHKGQEPWNKGKKIIPCSPEQKEYMSGVMKEHWKNNQHPRKGKPSWLSGRKGTNPYSQERCDSQRSLMKSLFANDPDIPANMSAETHYFLYNGEPLEIFNLKKYCRDKNLNYTLMFTAISKNVEYNGYQRNNDKYDLKISVSTRESKLTCPHCNHTGKKISAMSRWHFDNCKLAPVQGFEP